jgi:hypothetical protein
MRSGVSAISVHGAARSLGPRAADGVTKSGTAASIGGLNASGLDGSNIDTGRLAEDGLASCGGGRRTGGGSGGGSSLGRSGVLAAILAAIGDEAVAVSRTAVSVGAAASTVRAVGIARGTAEVLTAPAVIPGGNGGGLGSYRLSRVAAARQTSRSAMALGGSTPTVLRAAGTAVDCALGVAEQVAVGRTTLTVLGVLGLPLLWDDLEVGRRDLGVVALDVGDTVITVTVLSGQAAAGGVDVASRVDPVEVDVG